MPKIFIFRVLIEDRQDGLMEMNEIGVAAKNEHVARRTLIYGLLNNGFWARHIARIEERESR